MSNLRIPFGLCIKDKRLMKKRWEGMSLPQQVALKTLYGLPLTEDELPIFSAQQGFATYDDLGYVKETQPIAYRPKEYREAWMVVGRRGGKALAITTIIPTPFGDRLLKDLQAGDFIFAEDGLPAQISFITEVMNGKECFKVVFSDGSNLVADAEHKWKVWDKSQRKHGSRKTKVLTTKEIAESFKCRNGESRYAIFNSGPRQYAENKVCLPLDPYLLGVWLGDGNSSGARITSADSEILEAFVEKGFVLTPSKQPYNFGISGKNKFNREESFRSRLFRLNLVNNKHIPEQYFTASTEDRISLIQGLLDTDGYCDERGQSYFYSTNAQLANGFKRLLEGVGEKATIRAKTAKLNGKDCGLVYTVFCKPRFFAYRLSRKKAKQKFPKRPPVRYIVDVRKAESVPVRCLTIDHPSHMFLAGEAGIPTHNSDRFASTIVAYEACFGGHEEFVTKGQNAYVFQIAQDLRNAQHALHFIFAAIEECPGGKELLDGPPVRGEIRLKNNVIIRSVPCTLKATRGFACPVAVFDEVGVWYQESDSANPDYEIYRALKPAQIQFPNRLTVGISSPYNKSGLLFKYYEAGTDGRNAPLNEKKQYNNILVIHSPTAAMQNKLVSRESLEEERDRDVRAFERECLAVFQDSISGFLDIKKIKDAVDVGIEERVPETERYTYIAAIDPAFRHDAFGVTIFHLDEDGNVKQDCVRRYKPAAGRALNPEAIFSDLSGVLQSYGIVTIYSDQYHLESLQQLALKYGFVIEGVPFKATNKAVIYGSMQQLLNQGRLRLLDHAECLKELRMLEKRLSQGGVVQIAAPSGQYDDLAAVTAICCYKALWMAPKEKEEVRFKEMSIFEQVQSQIRRKRVGGEYQSWE